MSMSSVHGDIVTTTRDAICLAINGDPDDHIWIPRSVILEMEDDDDTDIDILIESWWYDKNAARFK